jgi:phosphoribosylamine--glycine ligase/phosphoribosylaminoimidazole synthetase
VKKTLNVLIVGSGGREHALGWKIRQSPDLGELYFAPGNAGTARCGGRRLGTNVAISVDDTAGLIAFAKEKAIDLVVVGPEVPLANGLVDDLERTGVRAFGPRRAAAQLETSKAFAKNFMQHHQIPTARFALFHEITPAMKHLRRVDYPVVIKASGLAAGKGVIVPENMAEAEAALQAMLVRGEFGSAGRDIVIEERLLGEEVSLLAFCDGVHVRTMPPAQDHKRLLAGDRGPNTGGMGAYAPAPVCPPELTRELVRTVLQPAIDGLRNEGMPFVGVLYAGLMLTSAGPRVLEFNCRFGDPETQAILPLLRSDLLRILDAAVDGRLDNVDVCWNTGSALCVVLASENYPGKVTSGLAVGGLVDANAPANTMVFHAGTSCQDNQVLTAGGRVLGVTGWGADLAMAHELAYQRVKQINFQGMQYRDDIGYRAMGKTDITSTFPSSAYAAAGVDIQAGNRAVELMSQAVRSTYGPEVLAGIGAFGGLFDVASLKGMLNPVLVASTDGVGTKVKLAAQAGRFDTIGQDLVNHCINDILVQGARPLFFLDYFASSRLQPEIVAAVVSGVAVACQEAGIALLGGETAEMPGVYEAEEFDLAGTIVGVVEKDLIYPRVGIKPGDLLVGLRSSGPHTNGFSLIRRIFADTSLDTVYSELGIPLAEALLAPHRSYFNLIYNKLGNPIYGIKALAHLTGGGFIENIPRVLPEGLVAEIEVGSWPVPALFQLIQRRGEIELREMHRVFNMGIGMVLVVEADKAAALQHDLSEETWIVGRIVSGEPELSDRGVRLV